MIPVRPQEPERPGSHAVSFQDTKAPVPVQGAIRLLEVQEYGTKDCIPDLRQIFYNISLEDGSTCNMSRRENMQGFMVSDRRVQPPVHYTGGGLPQDLH